MSPADQPQAYEAPRSTDPPTLWLSLVLGSVLIHLVLFIFASLFLTRTASVELDMEPISVEFVDPNTTTAPLRAPTRTNGARSGAPSSNPSNYTQEQPSIERSQPSGVNPSVEQPFVPQLRQRKPVPAPTQQPQPNPPGNTIPPTPNPANSSTQTQPGPLNNPLPQQPSSLDSGQSQPIPNSSQSRLPGSLSNPPESAEPPSGESQQPVEGRRIAQSPLGESVVVTVFNPRQPSVDVQMRAAQPTVREKSISIRYPFALSNQTIRLQATLIIDQNGSVLKVEKATLLSSSSGSAIDEATLNELANQIFTQWQFTPAQDASNGNPVMSSLSNLIIEAEVRLP